MQSHIALFSYSSTGCSTLDAMEMMQELNGISEEEIDSRMSIIFGKQQEEGLLNLFPPRGDITRLFLAYHYNLEPLLLHINLILADEQPFIYHQAIEAIPPNHLQFALDEGNSYERFIERFAGSTKLSKCLTYKEQYGPYQIVMEMNNSYKIASIPQAEQFYRNLVSWNVLWKIFQSIFWAEKAEIGKIRGLFSQPAILETFIDSHSKDRTRLYFGAVQYDAKFVLHVENAAKLVESLLGEGLMISIESWDRILDVAHPLLRRCALLILDPMRDQFNDYARTSRAVRGDIIIEFQRLLINIGIHKQDLVDYLGSTGPG